MIKAHKIKIEQVSKIVPNPENANKHTPEQITRLVELIEYQGFRNPLIISNRTGFLLAGHGRLEAAKKMGITELPVIYQDFDNEAQEYAYLISDNEIARWAELDNDLVQSKIKTFDDFNIDLLGIENFEVPIEELEPQCDEDDVPELKEDPITKRGDVWLLGNHKVMCGDSTMIDDVENLMDGNKADITFTSPPYNIGKSIRGNMYEEYTDNKSNNEYTEFLIKWTDLALQFSDYVLHNNQLLEGNKKSLIAYQYHYIDQIKDILIWNKNQYPPHINKGTFGCKWEYVFAMANDGKSKGFPCNWQGKHSNVISTENNSGNDYAKNHRAGYPIGAGYPIAFVDWIIDKFDFTKSIYEPFSGTGTNIISCEKNNVKCYAMELTPLYCDISIQRWQDYTGKKAILESNGKTYEELKNG